MEPFLGTCKRDLFAANALFTREYLTYIEESSEDEANRRAAWNRMGWGTAFYHGLPCAFSYVPRFFDDAAHAWFERMTHTTYVILRKVVERYLSDTAYRKEFRFDPRVEELVLLPSACPEPLPVVRVDFVLDENTGDFHFVEFNTDSSSGMDETRNAIDAVSVTEPFRRFSCKYETENDMGKQFEGWVRTFKRLYRASGGLVEQPQVAIVACLDSPNPEIGELKVYRELFEQAGMPCSVFDVRQLEFDGERLVGKTALAGASNVAIDCIWRFCIVVDLLEHWDDVQPFVEAVRQGKVEMIGSFATQIVHDKQLFAVLRAPATQAFLTDEECAFVESHVPITLFLDDPAVDVGEIAQHPEKWVIKPTDWYASKNVAAGPDYDAATWVEIVRDRVLQRTHQGISPYIVQEFHAPYLTPTVGIYGAEQDFAVPPRPYGNLLGAHVHAGEFAGLYVRQGPYNVIGSARAGLVAPVFWVREKV